MDTFGTRLQSEREERGLTIQSVAERLGVEQDKLLALERNDFESLPDEAAMMACLRAYAECLDVDAELMIEDYVQERDKCLARLAESISDRTVEIAPAAVPSYGDRQSSFPVLPVVYVMAAIVIVVGAWWMLSGDGAPAAPVETLPQTTSPSAPLTRAEPQPRADRPVPVTSKPATLRIEEYGVGTAVKQRRLVGESDRFAEGTKVWFWTRVDGGKAGDRVEHVWLEDGKPTARIPLKIGGSSWRTYSAKTLPAGSSRSWAVEARDARGRVLARREFSSVP
jgi:transcriptional regulator with XRE-family HTH domain